MVVPLFAARYLGRETFGQATLAITVGQFLSMFMLAGMNASVVRYSAPKTAPREEVTATLIVVALATVVVSLWLLIQGGPNMARFFGFGSAINIAGLVFAISATIFVLTTSILQGLHKFFERGIGELLTAVGVVVGLGVGIWLFGRHFASYVAATCLGFLAGSLYSIVYCWLYLGGLRLPDRKTLGVMVIYGLLSLFGNIGFILTFYIQPMLLNKLLSTSDVGLFRVYQTASITIALSLAVIFNTVFFPKASASSDRQGLWRVTWRLWAIAALPLGCAYILSQILLIPVAGHQYPIKMDLVLLFAVTSLVITVQTTVGQFLGAEGIRGSAAGLVISAISGILCIAATYVLVPKLLLKGACLALLGAYGIALIFVILAEEFLLSRAGASAQTKPSDAATSSVLEQPTTSEILPTQFALGDEDSEGDLEQPR
jgi:O-antigen/teichoic acid export membrane protein